MNWMVAAAAFRADLEDGISGGVDDLDVAPSAIDGGGVE